jgi:hypothetical protein
MTIWERNTMNKPLSLLLTLLTTCTVATAQFIADDPDWKETEVPPPPVFDLKRLVQVDVSVRSQLKWAIDPATIVINKQDGVVRYVVVAQSDSGVVNAMYEGIRCNKAQHRLYARHNPGSGWVSATNSDWQALRGAARSGHPEALAKQGICEGAAPARSAQEAVRQLRIGGQDKSP